MADKEMQKELESLRAEVAALSSARARERQKKPEPEPAPPQEDPETGAADAVAEAAAVDIEDADAVKTQMNKLLAQLEDDIRDMPTIKALGIFSLGVLFGRLMR